MDSKRIFVDTGGFVSLANKAESSYEQARKIFEAGLREGITFYTTDYVVDEFITLARCRQKEPVDQVVAFISGVHVGQINVVGITDQLFKDALKVMKKYKDQYFSFTDCVSFEVMKGMKMKKVLTTDKHFEMAGFMNLLRR